MTLTGEDVLLVERDEAGHVAIVTLNREERANALSIELCERLALRSAEAPASRAA